MAIDSAGDGMAMVTAIVIVIATIVVATVATVIHMLIVILRLCIIAMQELLGHRLGGQRGLLLLSL